MEYSITKDAEYMLCSIYQSYKSKLKSGICKSDAKRFCPSEIQESLMPEWNIEDVFETCRELSRAGLVQCCYADNDPQILWLEDESIVYMENKFQNGLKEVISYMQKIKNFIFS